MPRYAIILLASLCHSAAAFAQAPPPLEIGAATSKPGSVVDNPIFTKHLKPTDPEKGIPKLWTGGFQFGINGSEGNSDVLNVRTGLELRRETENNILTIVGSYWLARQDGTTTQNNSIVNARDEILFGTDNPWSYFNALQIEYDEFRAYDFRVGLYTGVGYMFIKDDVTRFQGRVGAGVQREFGTDGVEARWVPEGLVGFDYDHAFTDRQKFTSGLDVYPSLSNLGQYRVRARAAYEILLDPDSGTTLRLGLSDRYDSNPGDATTKKNDLNYFVTLLFKF